MTAKDGKKGCRWSTLGLIETYFTGYTLETWLDSLNHQYIGRLSNTKAKNDVNGITGWTGVVSIELKIKSLFPAHTTKRFNFLRLWKIFEQMSCQPPAMELVDSDTGPCLILLLYSKAFYLVKILQHWNSSFFGDDQRMYVTKWGWLTFHGMVYFNRKSGSVSISKCLMNLKYSSVFCWA